MLHDPELWDPLPATNQKPILLKNVAKCLDQGQRSGLGLWNHRDPASWLLLTVAALVLSAIFFLPTYFAQKEAAFLEELEVQVTQAQAEDLSQLRETRRQLLLKQEEFVRNIWAPKFMQNYVVAADILRDLEGKPAAEMQDILLDFTSEGAVAMADRQIELMDPIMEGFVKIETEVLTYYKQLSILARQGDIQGYRELLKMSPRFAEKFKRTERMLEKSGGM